MSNRSTISHNIVGPPSINQTTVPWSFLTKLLDHNCPMRVNNVVIQALMSNSVFFLTERKDKRQEKYK